MYFLYNLVVRLVSFLLNLIAIFNPKIKLFVAGRKNVFEKLKEIILEKDKTIWFHAASLGEYEQGLPVIEKVKETFPNHKIIITFFSPSGYEVRKNNNVGHLTIYLPLDTMKNAKNFLEMVQPELVFFIKYEFWPNYLSELKNHSRKSGTKVYLISGVFRKSQVFFKCYGSFYRNALQSFDYFFVQNENSKLLLQSIGYSNVKVSGDTRFDRVVSILAFDNTLDYIQDFKNNKTTIVIGSSWPKDETLLINYINNSNDIKFIIAPHNIKTTQIELLKNDISKKVVVFSEKENRDLKEYDVFIIDIIGILTKIYSYADIAYVGGGFGNPGVHNILEPATFGIPIVVGPNYSHFNEATELINLGGCTSIENQMQLNETFTTLISNYNLRVEKGKICSTYVQKNKGATSIILKHINE
jgi:3-deoxy-D-manno-octulosonic-acid transferase